jgi:hypothetical protein
MWSKHEKNVRITVKQVQNENHRTKWAFPTFYGIPIKNTNHAKHNKDNVYLAKYLLLLGLKKSYTGFNELSIIPSIINNSLRYHPLTSVSQIRCLSSHRYRLCTKCTLHCLLDDKRDGRVMWWWCRISIVG